MVNTSGLAMRQPYPSPTVRICPGSASAADGRRELPAALGDAAVGPAPAPLAGPHRLREIHGLPLHGVPPELEDLDHVDWLAPVVAQAGLGEPDVALAAEL